jgi:ribosomal protein S18 acetylase RimI-like enzyme
VRFSAPFIYQDSLYRCAKAHPTNKTIMKENECIRVEIVNYEPKYKAAFRVLNMEWISTYFKMEDTDYKALDNPEDYILAKGGHILVAIFDNEPVGVCALAKMQDDEYDYELAKMAISPKLQGKHIGLILAQAVIEKAKSLGARNVYLESNTILEPAISLYRKLGFQEIVGRPSPYERANIKMLLDLNE